VSNKQVNSVGSTLNSMPIFPGTFLFLQFSFSIHMYVAYFIEKLALGSLLGLERLVFFKEGVKSPASPPI
jgi:hypothetical protein